MNVEEMALLIHKEENVAMLRDSNKLEVRTREWKT